MKQNEMNSQKAQELTKEELEQVNGGLTEDRSRKFIKRIRSTTLRLVRSVDTPPFSCCNISPKSSLCYLLNDRKVKACVGLPRKKPSAPQFWHLSRPRLGRG